MKYEYRFSISIQIWPIFLFKVFLKLNVSVAYKQIYMWKGPLFFPQYILINHRLVPLLISNVLSALNDHFIASLRKFIKHILFKCHILLIINFSYFLSSALFITLVYVTLLYKTKNCIPQRSSLRYNLKICFPGLRYVPMIRYCKNIEKL